MKKHLLICTAVAVAAAATLLSTAATAQTTDTLAKVKASGTITMGVRESSGGLSYTLGDGKYVGYHVEICGGFKLEVQRLVDGTVTAS